jgi:hypothetical protein
MAAGQLADLGLNRRLARRIAAGAILGAVRVFVVATAAVIAAVGSAPHTVAARASTNILGPKGIADARFGETEHAVVTALTAKLGPPSARLRNTGCGVLLHEVAWHHLYAEFRGQRFEGVRYIAGPWPVNNATRKSSLPRVVSPRLATAKGITLGSTLGELRSAYRPLRLIGTHRWRSGNGLIFYDNAQHDPPPSSSRIVEIKAGQTCGDF